LHCIVTFVLVGKCEKRKGRLGGVQDQNLASAVVANMAPAS